MNHLAPEPEFRLQVEQALAELTPSQILHGLDDEAAYKMLCNLRWPEHKGRPRCPRCFERSAQRIRRYRSKERGNAKGYTCLTCHKLGRGKTGFSYRLGSLFEGSTATNQALLGLLVMARYYAGLSDLEASQDFGISPNLVAKYRAALAQLDSPFGLGACSDLPLPESPPEAVEPPDKPEPIAQADLRRAIVQVLLNGYYNARRSEVYQAVCRQFAPGSLSFERFEVLYLGVAVKSRAELRLWLLGSSSTPLN
ncbi:MAG: transposase [bacterium]|nr:transposase [bacterium]